MTVKSVKQVLCMIWIYILVESQLHTDIAKID